MGELTGLPAIALAGLVARREASAGEVVAAHLDRIAAVEPLINAVVAMDAGHALAAARVADAALARGEPVGPLHGVPVTVKDNIEAAGLEMTMGDPARTGLVPARDATAVARLKRAGAILLGKTNCPPYGGGTETDNPVSGRTNNPWNLSQGSSGSSAGPSSATAAGLASSTRATTSASAPSSLICRRPSRATIASTPSPVRRCSS